jgi:hypothetical protein
MLLVVIVIGLLIYYIDIMGITGGRIGPKPEKPEDQPWAKENLLRDSDSNKPAASPAKTPQASTKPVIGKPLMLTGEVASKDANRGQVSFTIQPDGTIAGNWQCQYSYTHAAYVITAAFKGNTDATQNDPADSSRLFLIAKGDYLQKATNLDSGEITETKGTLYISGWLTKDLAASGKLSLTDDKRWHVDYTWTAK